MANAAALFNALPTQMAQLSEALKVKRVEAGETLPAEAPVAAAESVEEVVTEGEAPATEA
jgi:large subunit ribosomal protein L10